jgi:uroporphyrinogen decarboxylase
MNHRERFTSAMQHQTPDRVPIDIGATSLTGMRPECQRRLSDLLGFSGQPVPVNNGIDERILRWAGTDFRSVGGIVSLPNREFPQNGGASIDCWGIQRTLIDGESQITHYPLHHATIEDLRAYPWPEPRLDEAQLAQWETQARKLKQDNEYVVIAEHPVFGILELGCWMCGYDDFLLKLAGDLDFVRTFFDIVFDLQMKVIEQYYAVLGPYIDLTTSGDDFGMQTGPLISPRAFKAVIAPYFKARIHRTKQLSPCYYWHHSCGSVYALMEILLECGVDILNPVQTSAARMDPITLKEAFGENIVFWGGVDVQQFLRQASPAEVRQGIRELNQVLGRGGGYVMAPGHEMQKDIPPENIAAWVDTINVA